MIPQEPPAPSWFVAGADFAQSSNPRACEGGVIILGARLRPEAARRRADERRADRVTGLEPLTDYHVAPVFGRRYKGIGPRQYSGVLHDLHRRFDLSALMIDPGAGGGGPTVQRELRNTEQVIGNQTVPCVPIVTLNDPDAPVVCTRNLMLFSRGEPALDLLWRALKGDDLLLDAAHKALRDALDRRELLLPPDPREWDPADFKALSSESRESLSVIHAALNQLLHLAALTDNEGHLLMTRNNAVQIVGGGRKDLAMTLLYAFVALLAWLRRQEERFRLTGGDDGGGAWSVET